MSEDIKLEEVNQTDSPSEEESKDTQEPTQEETPDEWSGLTGKARDRFKKIITQKNEVLQKLEQIEEENRQLREKQLTSKDQPTTTENGRVSPEEQAALNRLKQLKAFVTPEELESERSKIRAEFQAERDRAILNTEHDKLEGKFDGSDEFPAYDRTAVEDYMRKEGVYNPLAAYRQLHWDEIVDIESKKRNKTSKEPYTERTKSRIASGQPWTPESLGERLKQKDGREFYVKNREKINKLQTEWAQSG